MSGPDRRPIRVGFVVHRMDVAGAEVLVAESIRRLANRIAPVICCLDAVGTLGERLRHEGTEVVCLDRRAGVDLRVARRLGRIAAARRLDVLHAHQYTPFFYAALARVLAGNKPRLVLTEHGRHYPDRVSPRRRLTNRLVLSRLATDVNAVCRFSAAALASLDGFGARDIEIIPNGIAFAGYGRAIVKDLVRERLGLDPARRYVVNVARLHPVKDHATLLRAFARVVAVRRDADLLVAGDGPLAGSLRSLARALGIETRVRFLGVRDDVADLLGASDVFALTSVSEAASMTLLEAMASALPVVATAVGGTPEIVREGVDGLLVPRGDDCAVAAAILKLLADRDAAAAMGRAGAARVRECYRLEDTIERYYALYARSGAPIVPARSVYV